MKTKWIIVIIVIVVIILFVAYKLTNKPKQTLNPVKPRVFIPSTTPVVNLPLEEQPSTDKVASVAETVTETKTETKTETVVDQQKVAQPIIEKYDDVFCASLPYRQKLSLLAIDVQQAQGSYDIAMINYKTKKSDKTTIALNAANKKLEIAKATLLEYHNRCSKKV